ncbi:hypothetical protein SMITH_469 [Smithella sp. ME-1]|nr:hypothetical protein SMITH_469 [Smithella sp. ME-1]
MLSAGEKPQTCISSSGVIFVLFPMDIFSPLRGFLKYCH